jgi:glycosyltransferase involved in cell wall biosynthesis
MTEKKNRVLYLSYDGLTDPLGQSQILPYILSLSKSGYGFTIVSFEKKHRVQSEKDEIADLCKRHRVEWIPLPYLRWPPILSTLYCLLVLWHKVKKLHEINHFQIVHCRSYLTAIVGLWLKKKYDLKMIFDMRGFWADERVEGGLWNLNNPVYRKIYQYFKRKEKQFLLQSDHVISLTRNAKSEIASWSIKHAPITVIPTCVDLDVFNPEKITHERKEYQREQLGLKPDDFVLLYLGSWGTWYMTEAMLTFFEKIKVRYSNARFLIVTPDKVEIGSHEFRTDIIIISVPRKDVPVVISLANVAVFFIKPSYSKKASSATKMAEILAMEIPVVTNSGWGDVDVFSDSLILVPENGEISDLTDLDFSGFNFKAIRKRLEREMSLSFGTVRYAEVYQSLLRTG